MFRIDQAALTRMHLLSRSLRKDQSVRCGPNILTVETTTDCNLKCLTCHRTKHPEEPRLMSMELFGKILDGAGRGVEFVNLFGMGEPLLDPHLPERIRACSERRIRTHVATNGTLLDDGLAEALVDSRLSDITFSMNSVRPDVYERLHEGANYGETVRNVENFLAVKKRKKSPVYVTIEMIRTHLTARECDAVMKRWLDVEGVNTVRIRHDEFGSVSDLLDEDDHWTQGSGICHYLWQGPLLIRADGGMHPCCVSALHSRAMADANEISPKDFWASEEMAGLRERQLRGLAHERLFCRSCRAPKPTPLLGYVNYFSSVWAARRIAMLVERLSLSFHWRLQRRELI